MGVVLMPIHLYALRAGWRKKQTERLLGYVIGCGVKGCEKYNKKEAV